MSNLNITPQWHENINQVEVTEPIVGGDGGNANLATRQLAENTFYLEQERIKHMSAENPHEQYVLLSDYQSKIRELMSRIDMISSGLTNNNSGVLVGLLDVTYSDTAISQNDFSGAGVVKVNEKSGYTFGYPTTLQLPKPIGNAPRAYNHITTILLPIEYDSAIHRLSVVNSSGTYEIKEAEKSVVFSSPVSSVNQGDSETKNTLNTTLRISMYNK